MTIARSSLLSPGAFGHSRTVSEGHTALCLKGCRKLSPRGSSQEKSGSSDLLGIPVLPLEVVEVGLRAIGLLNLGGRSPRYGNTFYLLPLV